MDFSRTSTYEIIINWTIPCRVHIRGRKIIYSIWSYYIILVMEILKFFMESKNLDPMLRCDRIGHYSWPLSSWPHLVFSSISMGKIRPTLQYDWVYITSSLFWFVNQYHQDRQLRSCIMRAREPGCVRSPLRGPPPKGDHFSGRKYGLWLAFRKTKNCQEMNFWNFVFRPILSLALTGWTKMSSKVGQIFLNLLS